MNTSTICDAAEEASTTSESYQLRIEQPIVLFQKFGMRTFDLTPGSRRVRSAHAHLEGKAQKHHRYILASRCGPLSTYGICQLDSSS